MGKRRIKNKECKVGQKLEQIDLKLYSSKQMDKRSNFFIIILYHKSQKDVFVSPAFFLNDLYKVTNRFTSRNGFQVATLLLSFALFFSDIIKKKRSGFRKKDLHS